MLTGVIFDMDGVIINSHPAHRIAWRQLLASVGREVSEAELDYVLDGRTRQDILRHFLGNLNEEQLLRYGRSKESYFFAVADSVTTVDGIVEFLAELESGGIAAAVATSATRLRAEALLEQFDLRGHFVDVVTGNDVVCGKPDPAIFQLAASRLNKPLSELVVVEDAVSGVRAARAAGMRCVGIGGQERAPLLLSAGAHAVFPDFRAFGVSALQHVLACA